MQGRLRVPGDKSISHRALILGALTVGETTVAGLLEGEDVLRTAAAMRALGAKVERGGDGLWRIHGVGVGGFAQPAGAARLRQFRHRRAAGDRRGRRLRRSPRPSTATPRCASGRCGACSIRLAKMGARVIERRRGRPPAADLARRARSDADRLRAAGAVGAAEIGGAAGRPRRAGRDHGDRGAKRPAITPSACSSISAPSSPASRMASTAAASRCKASPSWSRRTVVVPADPSSAAFPLVAALIVPGSDVMLEAVMTNPLRTGLYHDAARDGRADRGAAKRATTAARRSPTCACAPGALKGVEVPAERAPSMIDEYPILAVAASFAEGVTRMRGLKELRVKESDRLAATAAMLRANGVDRRDRRRRPDRARQAAAVAGGGEVATHMDHRIAMAALVMGLAPRQSGAHRRLRLHRHQLSRLRRADALARRADLA